MYELKTKFIKVYTIFDTSKNLDAKRKTKIKDIFGPEIKILKDKDKIGLKDKDRTIVVSKAGFSMKYMKKDGIEQMFSEILRVFGINENSQNMFVGVDIGFYVVSKKKDIDRLDQVHILENFFDSKVTDDEVISSISFLKQVYGTAIEVTLTLGRKGLNVGISHISQKYGDISSRIEIIEKYSQNDFIEFINTKFGENCNE